MFETAELGQTVGKREYKEREALLREELLEAQFRLKASDFPVIVLLHGVDGAGKGETANLLNEWMDTRLMATRAYDYERPTTEASERPPFWRYWRDLPPAGRMGIYLKGWYSEPFIKRVNGEITQGDFDEALARIRAFERTLGVGGAVILKFWLHLGKKQQKRRLKALESDPAQAWRVTKTDWEHWERYEDFVPVAEHLIMRTSTGLAPWEIVEGLDPGFRNLEVGSTLLRGIRRGMEAEERRRVEPGNGTVSGVVDGAEDELLPPQVNLGGGERESYSRATVLSTLEMTRTLDKTIYRKELARLQGQFNSLHREARDRLLSTILIFEGWDAAGKGGAIRRVVRPLDARHYQVIAVGAPTDEERAHHYLWRFWRHLPRAGRVTIFDRSWYGRVLVERVEGFATEREWMRAYTEINDFEDALVQHGIVLMKFWLHITPEEQEARFRAREESPLKRWKMTPEDWRNRARWDAYEKAVNDMVERTSTQIAPWTLVEGNDKRYARVQILEECCRRLERVLKEKGPERKG
jgi:polyphosphate:AMP phosphotransferase